jgi:hypothetical protein
LHGGRNPVDANDHAAGPYNVRGQERNITGATTHIEHAHARTNTSGKKALRDRVDKARLAF